MTRQEALNMYDLLKGIVNRMFISDDPKEVQKANEWANRYLQEIHKYNEGRVNHEN